MPKRRSAVVVRPPIPNTVNATAPIVAVSIALPSSPRRDAASSASAKAIPPRKPLNQSIFAWFAGNKKRDEPGCTFRREEEEEEEEEMASLSRSRSRRPSGSADEDPNDPNAFESAPKKKPPPPVGGRFYPFYKKEKFFLRIGIKKINIFFF